MTCLFRFQPRPVCGRGDSEKASETAVEMRYVVESRFVADVGDLKRRILQQPAGRLKPVPCHETHESLSRLPLPERAADFLNLPATVPSLPLPIIERMRRAFAVRPARSSSCICNSSPGMSDLVPPVISTDSVMPFSLSATSPKPGSAAALSRKSRPNVRVMFLLTSSMRHPN